MGINVFARKSRIDESVCNEDEAGCDDTGVPLSDNTGRPEAKTSSVQLSGSRSGWELGGGDFFWTSPRDLFGSKDALLPRY